MYAANMYVAHGAGHISLQLDVIKTDEFEQAVAASTPARDPGLSVVSLTRFSIGHFLAIGFCNTSSMRERKGVCVGSAFAVNTSVL